MHQGWPQIILRLTYVCFRQKLVILLWIIAGGLGLNATKYARIAEYTSADGAVAVCLAGHQAIGLKVGILKT